MKLENNQTFKPGKFYALPFLIILYSFSGYRTPFFFGTAYVFATALFFFNIRTLFQSILSNRIYLISGFYLLLTALISNYPTKVMINFVHFVGMTFSIILFTHYLDGNTKKLFQILIIFGVITVIVSIVSAIGFPNIGIEQISGRWRGMTTHPNTLGLLALVCIWIAFMSFYFLSGKLFKFMSILTILGCFICLYGSNSVTSSICSVFVLIAGPVLISTENNASVTVFLKIFYLVIGSILFLGIIYAFYPEKLGLDQFFASVGRDVSLTGRTTLWEKGFQAFWAKPVFGWGYDSNASILSQSVISYGQFHNGYLNTAVAGGCIGLILLMLLIGKQLLLCLKLREYNFRMAMGFLVLILSILIHNIPEASFFRATHILWLMFVFSLYILTYQLYGRTTNG